MQEKYINIILQLALKAYKKNEVPVGALITKNNKIIAKAYNDRQRKCDVTGHAEVLCIKKAAKRLKDWRLTGCDLYVTLEPCNMCKTIIEESRISNVYYLESSNYNNKKSNTVYKKIQKSKNATELLKLFFEKQRKK